MNKEYDIIIFINSAGPNINLDNIKDTIYSFDKNIGNYKYCYYFVTDNSDVYDFLLRLNYNNFVVIMSNESWAKNFNAFFDLYKDKADYIIISHDDLAIETEDFFTKTLKEIEGKEHEVGWITFTSNGYYKLQNIPMANSAREGFAKDRYKYPFLYECHNFNPGDRLSEANKHLFDYPERAVKCHAIFPHLMLIKSDTLKKIGYCEDWTKYTLLIDEDWGLEALKNNLWNIWIPNIFYTHPLRYEKRPSQGVRFEPEAHAKFAKKWGFYFGNQTYTDDFIRVICEKYKNTNIPFSANKNTYEWEYFKN